MRRYVVSASADRVKFHLEKEFDEKNGAEAIRTGLKMASERARFFRLGGTKSTRPMRFHLEIKEAKDKN